MTKTEGGVYICTEAAGEEVSLAVYEQEQGPDGERKEKRRVFPFPKGSRMGRMRCMKLLGEDFFRPDLCRFIGRKGDAGHVWPFLYWTWNLGRAFPCGHSPEEQV